MHSSAGHRVPASVPHVVAGSRTASGRTALTVGVRTPAAADAGAPRDDYRRIVDRSTRRWTCAEVTSGVLPARKGRCWVFLTRGGKRRRRRQPGDDRGSASPWPAGPRRAACALRPTAGCRRDRDAARAHPPNDNHATTCGVQVARHAALLVPRRGSAKGLRAAGGAARRPMMARVLESTRADCLQRCASVCMTSARHRPS